MTNPTTIPDAESVLLKALTDAEPDAQAAAVKVLHRLFLCLFGLPGRMLEQVLPDFRSPGDAEKNRGHGEEVVVRQLVPLLATQLPTAVFLLLRTLHPRWTNGGEPILNRAPPFEELRVPLMNALRTGEGDFVGGVAILIGRYGPDARPVLAELLDILRRRRRDCQVAAGLTWAVYMIGGSHPSVTEVLREVASRTDSCPHAQPLAVEILERERED